MSLTNDEKFLQLALNLAQKGVGSTAPNPCVGCVIVKNDQIISSGITAKNGRPHAEVNAISKVENKELLQGATIYVTLEPCAHFGVTSPCSDEIIKYKFAKVVIAMLDCDERVNGRGVEKLKQAGIEVKILHKFVEIATDLNRGFFKAKLSKMPFVTLKLATSLDGKIAAKDQSSKWITGEKARNFAHLLRAKNDAILVGANTVRKDDPSLDCRILGLENFSPQIVVMTKNFDFSLAEKIFQNSANKPILLAPKSSEKNCSAEILQKAQVIFCQEKADKIDLEDALKKLATAGFNAVLVEGGSFVATEFLRQNLVDELVWIRSVKIIGNDGIAAIGDLGNENISQVLNKFRRVEVRDLGEDLAEILQKI